MMRQPSTAYASPTLETPLSQKGTAQILMCPPTYFDVRYAINPWMQKEDGTVHSVDVAKAKSQWETLYDTIRTQAGANVHLLEPVKGLPDLVFTANAAFVYEDRAIIANYKHHERQAEQPFAEQWFKANGFNVTTLPEDIYFEGAGDALVWEQEIFAGYFARSDIQSHHYIRQLSGLPVHALALENPRFYHVDVCLCPLAKGDLLYAPDAFTDEGTELIEAIVPKENRIPVTLAEAETFSCNAISINQSVIMHGDHPNTPSRIATVLAEKGYELFRVDLGEFIKAGGSAKCLSLRVG